MKPTHAVFAALLLLIGLASASAQTQTPPKPTNQTPPALTVGKRVLAVQVRAQRISTLLIAPDAAAYAQAIALWSPEQRFPVLIDDGTPGARHDISRFIHSYKPEQILYLPAGGDDPDPTAIDRALAEAWDAAEGQSAPERWKELQFIPPGVVVATPDDPAWTAALALGADRGQPIIWIDNPNRHLNQIESEDSARAWRAKLRTRIEQLGYSWSASGDDLEALTLCLSYSTKFRLGDRIMAITDFLARNDDNTAWGACGMITGSEAEAAYDAMSALFLQPRSVWMFDGYTGNFGAEYAIDRAAGSFRQAGFDRVLADPRPNGGRATWRARLRAGIDAGLVFVNSSGHAKWFNLADQRAYGSDIPFLRQPAMVHFIHSFSAQFPGITESIAARWLDQGAFIYYGSCDEPGLAAFLTPEQVTGRMLIGIPAGFACRYDSTNIIWKLNYFGDPLFTLANIPAPEDKPIEIDGAVTLKDRMATTLRDQDFENGVAALVMLGRHEDVVRVCRSLAASRPETLTPSLIETALPSHLFEREPAALAKVYNALPPDRAKAPRNTTLLWQALRPELDRLSAEQASLLRLAIRSESADDDAAALAPAMRRLYGEGAVKSMYAQLISEADNDQMRDKLMRAAP
ncbi:MAG: hypothetical protein ACF8MJ_12120 [Phycisphaerales bacterium JB050]